MTIVFFLLPTKWKLLNNDFVSRNKYIQIYIFRKPTSIQMNIIINIQDIP